MVAGTGSGVGKTTVSTGLMAAMARHGLKVQGFKVGPDYIDPSYHTEVTNRSSRNLDSYLLTDRKILECFLRASADADISIVEGVMGLYDGLNGTSDVGSTASVAKLLNAPVLLVVDAWSSARSVAASVLGFSSLDRKVNLAGVILNRVAGEKHVEWCTQAIKKYAKVPVVGWLPKSEKIQLPERHLGLIPYTEERPKVEGAVGALAEFIEKCIDLEMVKKLARSAPLLTHSKIIESAKTPGARVRVGLAVDEAFSFYYADAIDLLKQQGAEIVLFSPIHDSSVPDGLNGMYIGGGFPEEFSTQLEMNEPMRRSVRARIEGGIPTYAECGGMMYLTRLIRDFQGSSRSMVGVLEADTVMTRKLTLGYMLARAVRDSLISGTGDSLRGHEYHFSEISCVPNDASFAFEMTRGNGISNRSEGWTVHNLLACYSHTHFCSRPKTVSRFLDGCLKYSRR
jgi:cobyrinic acid a,c-diamide synthase